ncbi:MAG: hypothetical protein VX246_10375 [Myxococcota bacterium]|nr:hypothetical protein [Myxococcota bacterium]
MTPTASVATGSLLVSLLDPKPGDARGFHRWYERDHFYSGCMLGPRFFAGRRYVATRDHRALRYPDLSPVVPNMRAGSCLALYWIEAGHHDEAESWAVERVNALNAADRMHPREQVHAGFYDRDWSWERDADGVPIELALDHPSPGLLFLCVDRNEGVTATQLAQWYTETFFASLSKDSSVACCLAATPRPLPDDAPAYVRRVAGLEQRTLLVFFCEADPVEVWQRDFMGHSEAVNASGLGAVSFASPFVPTIPGTDAYCADL